MNRARRGHRGLTFGVAVVTTLALAGGIAYATIPGTGNVFSACMLKGIGTIRLIDKSLPSTNLMSRCTDKEIEISWNQAGQPGPPGPEGAKGEPGTPGTNGANGTNGNNGLSVTSAAEPAGANCAGGGVQLTAFNGISYVCNGKAGADGKDGANGTDGVDGDDGVSVTSAVEPVGANCANGGSKFTAATGVTYACNGAPGASGSGRGPIRSVQLPVGGPVGNTVGNTPTTMVLFDIAGIGRFTAQCGTNGFYNGNGVGQTTPRWEYSNTSGQERTLFAQASNSQGVGLRFASVAPGGVMNIGTGSQGLLDQIQVFPSSAGTATSPAAEVSIAGFADENSPYGAPCTFWASATTL